MAGIKQKQRPLKIGLLLPHWTGSQEGKTPRWTDILAMAQLAEEIGLDSLWVVDDLLLSFETGDRVGMWECWSLLAALAASTKHITLGSLVSCNNFRNPALLAKIADTVDEMSGGRIVLGLGAGGEKEEHQTFGFPWEERFSRLEEALIIVQSLLQTGYANFVGKYYQVQECELSPRGPRQHGPPLLIGTSSTPGPRLLRLVAHYATYWNGWLGFERSAPDVVPPLRQKIDAACHTHNRDPETLERTLSVGMSISRHQIILGPWNFTEGAIKGEQEEITEILRAFAHQGISHLQLYLAPSTLRGIEALVPILEMLERG
ncbi:LLM class flavin-dependent oxidoreductase [Ktedonosporobacter rubrisoli]|uniref:LLM class flavin-dependent oxidoreductase n=1 Tax=Ktedonosporobacter rubrisoli TaxID=2509675 RepID=A0A4P6JP93_KTERU|nr:LLM class flavin-dependent oxidoreductase [Ktedonosporobacter rubrisoli]QBD77187.1 LLM class flavin-dependent oxidoreductase [Ktedonosporobacter rubrisoli]